MALTPEQRNWLRDVLGVTGLTAADPPPTAAAGLPRVGVPGPGQPRPTPPTLPRLPVTPTSFGLGEEPVAAVGPMPPEAYYPPATRADGGKVEVRRMPDGKLVVAAPAPPVKALTFSGGGGKGAALPGVVQALADRPGLLDGVSTVTGASVGSMTAALVASGITPDAFRDMSADAANIDRIKDQHSGFTLGLSALANVITGGHAGGLDGDGLELVVREQMNKALLTHISAYLATHQDDPAAAPVREIADKLRRGDQGATFAEMRRLSFFIPQIKDIAVTGTRMGAAGPDGSYQADASASRFVFDADATPDVEVARAVHASAALPPVFKPVTIDIPKQGAVRFEDGGVMNNTPTLDSLGQDRDSDLDFAASGGNLSFVFESDEAQQALTGRPKPKPPGLMGDFTNWLTNADNTGAEFALAQDVADSAQDVVMVPLRFQMPDGKGGTQDKDFTGFFSGTVNFDMPPEDRMALQQRAQSATEAALDARATPRTRTWDSDAQMLMRMPLADLQALATGPFPGAAEALAFRQDVAVDVQFLVDALSPHLRAGESPQALAQSPEVVQALASLQANAQGDLERLGFVASELYRVKVLDPVLQAHAGNCPLDGPPDLTQACKVVGDALAVRQAARRLLQDKVWPRMARLQPDSPWNDEFKRVVRQVQAARTPQALAQATAAFDQADQGLRRREDAQRERELQAQAQAMSMGFM